MITKLKMIISKVKRYVMRLIRAVLNRKCNCGCECYQMALAKSQKSLKSWGKQKWRTKSGKPSTQGPKATGERYLPEKAIKSLSSSEYAATTRAKRKGTAKGKQFVAQPKKVRAKVKPHRKIKQYGT